MATLVLPTGAKAISQSSVCSGLGPNEPVWAVPVLAATCQLAGKPTVEAVPDVTTPFINVVSVAAVWAEMGCIHFLGVYVVTRFPWESRICSIRWGTIS